MMRLIRSLLTLAVLAVAGGYLVYLAMVAIAQPDEAASADAIVALTGGGARLQTALRLLEEGRGERLLISGVSDQATEADIRAMAPDDAARFECCVDLDRAAANTVGNARETADWARRHGYDRVLLVTDSFHMPRARLELSRTAPDVTFVPWPASKWGAKGLRGTPVEYAKLLVVLGREALRRAAGTRA
jgi:uncharacterized SAM-binding protein YcdF (DUF218 family)